MHFSTLVALVILIPSIYDGGPRSCVVHVQTLPPAGNTTFSVVFVARREGPARAHLYIHTSLGVHKYQVRLTYRSRDVLVVSFYARNQRVLENLKSPSVCLSQVEVLDRVLLATRQFYSHK